MDAMTLNLDPGTAALRGVPANTGVPCVPSVESSNHGLSAGTPEKNRGVPCVPETTTDTVADAIGKAETPVLSFPADKRPCFEVFDYPTTIKESAKPLKPGVWFLGVKGGGGDKPPELTQQWICTPLHIEAQTADADGNSYGRLLRFRTTRSTWRVWACPMALLAGDGTALREALFDAGAKIDPAARLLFAKYLLAVNPKRRVHCVDRTGWTGDAFVLPDAVIGKEPDAVVYQGGRAADEYGTAGTLESWRENIASKATGNPALILALSAAFAATLLNRCHAENGGIHFVGHSSSGKTTAVQCAVSVWGAPAFRGSWRATANGLEGAACLHNDALLALDEIHEADPREVGRIVYMVGNGRGKQRAGRNGTAKPVASWRCVLLSSGEQTLATTLATVGERQTAGQGVRLLDIPVPDTKQSVFADLHGCADGRELADMLKDATAKHYGHAIRTFIAKLADDTDDMGAALDKARSMLTQPGMDGQEQRVAGRFALFALAGELATRYAITGWAEGDAVDAAIWGRDAWRALRGTGRDERRQVIEALAQFIERNADGRFSKADENIPLRDRAGWWRRGITGGRVYLFNSSGLREALKGFDFKRALSTLETETIIPQSPTGVRSNPETVDGQKVRLYSVDADALEARRGHP